MEWDSCRWGQKMHLSQILNSLCLQRRIATGVRKKDVGLGSAMKVGEGLSKQESADVKAQMYRSGIIDDVKVVETSVLGDDRAVGSGGKVSSGSLKRKTASAGLTVF